MRESSCPEPTNSKRYMLLTTFYGKNEKIIDIIKCHDLTDSFEFCFIGEIYINKLY